ncbi:hypothetical protein BD769DRAFT_1388938 [Suillus cothurnatus]|nr:hypothetical protein BD769DRAFT_1388938 [Suillus cothurnatus]
MTIVSDDPSWWPFINASLIGSYFVGSWSVSHTTTVADLCCHFVVAGSVGVIYDWGLTFGKEVELIWRQRWSLMTFLYLSVRYAGIGCAVLEILISVPTISTTDAGCLNMYNAFNWISVVIEPLLGVIMIARLHAMYQRSRKVLIFLVVILLAVTL